VPGLAPGACGRWGSAGSVLRSQGTLGPAELSRYRATGIRVSTFLCSLRPDPAAAGLLGGLSLNGGGLIVGYEEKQSSLTRCVGVMALGALRALGALGWCGVRIAPTGHRIPARGETPGVPHNRSVLKERRITPGALTCFAVAECQGWRWGSVTRRGSAGSVLRSQGTLGPAGLSRYRATGIKVSTFLCSLRPDPAAAGLLGGLSLYGVV
jgi:hypothetical protein